MQDSAISSKGTQSAHTWVTAIAPLFSSGGGWGSAGELWLLCGCVVHCFVFWRLSIIASVEVFSSLSNSDHVISKRLHRLLVIPVIPSWIPFPWYSLPHTRNLFCFGDGLTKSNPPRWTLSEFFLIFCFFVVVNLFGLYLFGSTVYRYGVTQLHYLVCKKSNSFLVPVHRYCSH